MLPVLDDLVVMPRAFLSHSTDDKPFVDEVAKQLGRARTVIDVQSFEPGEDFRSAIRRTLDDSMVFVFFVSARSLASSWVSFELDEAEIRRMRGTLRRAIAIFIDGPVDAAQLPAWLQRVRAVQHSAPAQSARLIESLLLVSAPEVERPFIGRNEDIQRGVRKLSASNPTPRILVASGLEGVGRRSYLARLCRDALSLDIGPTIVLPATATLEDLFIETHLSATLLSRDDAERQLETFRSLPEREQATEVARQLIFLSQQGSAPCIVDKGSMLDSSGKYSAIYADVLEDFLDERDVFLCLAHARAPEIRELRMRSHVFDRRLRPLAQPDAQALVARLLRDGRVPATPDRTFRLAEVTDGYPPAAYFLVTQVEDYGIDVVLNDTNRLRDFNSRSFDRFLRDLQLDPVEREILVYLASESKLSLSGVATATGHSLDKTAAAIRQLVDLALVESTDDEYTVTAPILTSVHRVERGHGRRWYEAAYERLEQEFWHDQRALPPISVVDATLRAGLRIGRDAANQGSFVRPSLLINAAQERYDQKHYEEALEYLERARRMGARSAQLLEIQIKSQAQLRRFGEARKSLREYRETGERRQWYLDGFVDRKAGDHEQASSKFQRGYSRGDRSVSLLRDYADSLFRIDSIDDARVLAEEALTRQPGNIYVLDLKARIEIAGGSVSAAEEALDALEVADVDRSLILHRRASFLLLRRGNAEAVRRAVSLSEEATSRRGAPLEAWLTLARALIRAKRWGDLDAVKQEIGRRRSRDGHELMRSLDLQAAVTRGDWRRGEKLLPRVSKTWDERDLRAAVLELKSTDYGVPLDERKAAEKRGAKSTKESRRDPEPRPWRRGTL